MPNQRSKCKMNDEDFYYIKTDLIFESGKQWESEEKNQSKKRRFRSVSRSDFCDPVWIRTKDLQLRRLLLYPTELRDHLNSDRKYIIFSES